MRVTTYPQPAFSQHPARHWCKRVQPGCNRRSVLSADGHIVKETFSAPPWGSCANSNASRTCASGNVCVT